jgi:hypothetical protein
MFPSLCLAALSASPLAPFAAEGELSEAIRPAELKAHVYRLASPEFMGRRGPGAARASRHIADAFKDLKLSPAFGDSYYQPIPWLLTKDGDPPSFVGRNVGAVIEGSDPALKDEWVMVTAHFDHLGVESGADGKEILYAGADDNASGVAMLLELAERFALQKHKPRRTIVFVAFDQEESGLLGSAHFASKPPRPFKQLKAFITADMIGRSMANVMDEYVFVLGSESSPGLRKLLDKTPPAQGLTAGRIGADIIGSRSDYGPFRDRKVPFLFFSTGQHFDYHAPTDTPEKIDYAKLARIADWVHTLTTELADTDDPPAWNPEAVGPDLDEVRTIAALLTRVLDRKGTFPLTDHQRSIAESARDKLAGIVARGKVTALERGWLAWTAKLLLATMF